MSKQKKNTGESFLAGIEEFASEALMYLSQWSRIFFE
jgi:hypothetical protein